VRIYQVVSKAKSKQKVKYLQMPLADMTKDCKLLLVRKDIFVLYLLCNF